MGTLSTHCAIIFKRKMEAYSSQRDGWVDGEFEVARCYVDTDGYPEGRGFQIALCMAKVQMDEPRFLLPELISNLNRSMDMEFEPQGQEHGDLGYLYVVTDYGTHMFLEAYEAEWETSYYDITVSEPLACGTWDEYVWYLRDIGRCPLDGDYPRSPHNLWLACNLDEREWKSARILSRRDSVHTY